MRRAVMSALFSKSGHCRALDPALFGAECNEYWNYRKRVAVLIPRRK
jgi:hypothetical protein